MSSIRSNTQALGFYDACGFVKAGEIATRFRPVPRMRKSINVGR